MKKSKTKKPGITNMPKTKKNLTNNSKKIELLSINYLVDGKEHIARKDMNSNRGIVSIAANVQPLAVDESTSCGPDCKCVNGFVQRLVTFGGISHWIPTPEPC